MSESHQNLITYVQGKLLPWNKSVKQFKLLRVTYDKNDKNEKQLSRQFSQGQWANPNDNIWAV